MLEKHISCKQPTKKAGVAILIDEIDVKTKILLYIKKIFYNDKWHKDKYID